MTSVTNGRKSEMKQGIRSRDTPERRADGGGGGGEGGEDGKT
jgi:hypothetical protein